VVGWLVGLKFNPNPNPTQKTSTKNYNETKPRQTSNHRTNPLKDTKPKKLNLHKETQKHMASSLSHTGYLLALIGGIIIVLSGALHLLGATIDFFRVLELLPVFGGTIRAIVQIIIGAVCIAGSKYVSNLTWAIILLILGVIAGNLGGTLVLIGAILGLISTTYKHPRK
jgi:hypothetical protein